MKSLGNEYKNKFNFIAWFLIVVCPFSVRVILSQQQQVDSQSSQIASDWMNSIVGSHSTRGS